MKPLAQTAAELRAIVLQYHASMQSLSDSTFYAKSSPGKWSKVEVVGHLCDSAQNNLRRFVTSQYEGNPPHIIYDQDFWVMANQYGDASRSDILLLWKLLNERICAILEQMPEENYHRQCNTGKRGADVFHPVEWLARDYVAHLKHHLNQVIPSAFPGAVYPPPEEVSGR